MDGRAGFVPHNMVSEVQVDEDDLLDESPSPLPESQAGEYMHPHNEEPFNRHYTNTDPNQQLHNDNVPHQEHRRHDFPSSDKYLDDNVQHQEHKAGEVPRSNMHLKNNAPNQDYNDDNVPNSNEYLQNNVPRDHLPIDGSQPQYPTVVVHKPSDASLHEPDFQTPNPVPHDVSNETYNISEGGDDSMEFEDPRNSLNYSLEPRKMVALFDYDPQVLSPNPDSEVRSTFYTIFPLN